MVLSILLAPIQADFATSSSSNVREVLSPLCQILRKNGASSIWYGFPNEKENHLLIIEQWPSLETHHQFLHSKEFVGAANILESLLTGPIAQQYHVQDPSNVSHIFSCPLVEFAWFKVKWDKIYEYNIHNEKMSHITKNLPAFINGCGIYKLEDPWMHGLIAGWKFQENHDELHESQEFKDWMATTEPDGFDYFHVILSSA